MSKYIDADKLVAIINRLKTIFEEMLATDAQRKEFFCGKKEMAIQTIGLITSLQQEVDEPEYGPYARQYTKAKVSQEQPKVDLVAELKHHLATTPKEQLEKEWKELEPWGNIGPTVQEFLYGKQPEVDLEKEIQDWCKENVTGVKPIYTADSLIYDLLPKTARHFWNKGYNARKKQKQPEGIEGVVHHYANVHYIETNTEQLNARLKDFEDGAEVRVFINTRKEE